jgi:hypothetical protein
MIMRQTSSNSGERERENALNGPGFAVKLANDET